MNDRNKLMPQQERDQAIEALARWFESQDISLADAVPVCGEFISITLAAMANSRTHLQRGVRATNFVIREYAEEVFARLEEND